MKYSGISFRCTSLSNKVRLSKKKGEACHKRHKGYLDDRFAPTSGGALIQKRLLGLLLQWNQMNNHQARIQTTRMALRISPSM
jgi:asparagine synthetase A